MAFHFLIDGYNLLYALPEIPPGSLEDKRNHLLKWLQERRPQGNNKLTVVFDSRQGSGDRLIGADMNVFFTAGETADECISDLVRAASHPRTLVVVSNDKGIQTHVRGTGARFIFASEFIQRVHRPQAAPQATHPPDEILDEISEELKKKWL